MNSIGQKIKKLRLQRGYNQTELAKLSRLTAPAICQFEAGTRLPNINSICDISKALGVTTDELLFDIEISENQGKQVVAMFNSLSEDERDHVIKYLKFLSLKK